MIIVDPLVYSTGLIFALYDDRHGDKHPNRDWLAIGLVILGTALCVSLTRVLPGWVQHDFFDWGTFLIGIIKGCAMGTAHCILLFSWAVSLMMIKRKTVELPAGEKWYNHFSDSAIPDKWPLWRKLHWSIRATIWAILSSPLYYLYSIL